MADDVFRRRLEELLLRDFGVANVGAVPLPGVGGGSGETGKDQSRLPESTVPEAPGYDPLSSVQAPARPRIPSLEEMTGGADAAPMKIPTLEEMAAIPPTTTLGALGNAAGRGWNELQKAWTMGGNAIGAIPDAEAAQRIAADELDKRQYPAAEWETDAQRQLAEAPDWWEKAKVIGANPGALVSGVMAESAPQAIPSMVLGGILAPAGPAAASLGVGVGSGLTEAASTFTQVMSEQGVDLTDPASIEAGFNDPMLMASAKASALKRGVAVGTFDTLTAMIGGRFLRPVLEGATSTGRKVAGTIAAGGVESIGGMGGEATAQKLDKGKIEDSGAILLEGVAELPGVVTDAGVAAVAGAKPEPPIIEDRADRAERIEPALGTVPPVEDLDGAGVESAPVLPPVATDPTTPMAGPPGAGSEAPQPAASPSELPASPAPLPAPQPVASAVPPETRAVLRRMGYPDEIIDTLDPEQAALEAQDAAEEGVEITDQDVAAAATYEQPAPEPVPMEDANDRAGIPLDQRGDPVVGTTEDPVLAGGAPVPSGRVRDRPADGGRGDGVGTVPVRPDAPVPGAPGRQPGGPLPSVVGDPAERSDGGPAVEPIELTVEDVDRLPTDPDSVARRMMRAGIDEDRARRLASGIMTDDQGEDISLNPVEEERYFSEAVRELQELKRGGAAPAAAEPRPTVGDGTRARPARVEREEDMGPARERVAEPTDGQAQAGNYSKGHVRFAGMDITIETKKGQTRRSKDPANPWESVSPADYGYFKRTKGKDGDHLDVYLGPQPDSGRAFVIDQYDPKTGRFDEHKVILGTASEAEATGLYDAAFGDGSGPSRRGGVREMQVAELKKRMERYGGLGRRPLGGPRPAAAAEEQPAPAAEETPPPAKLVRERQSRARPDEEGIVRRRDGVPVRPPRLWRFLAGLGGVKDEGGELSRRDLRRFPGLINNRRGRSLDYAREAAAEAGYFGIPEDEWMGKTTGSDLLDLLDEDLRGGPDGGVYSHRADKQRAAWEAWRDGETAEDAGADDGLWQAHRDAVAQRLDEYEEMVGDELPPRVRADVGSILAQQFWRDGADTITDEDINKAVDQAIRELERENLDILSDEAREEDFRDLDAMDPELGRSLREMYAENPDDEIDIPFYGAEETRDEGRAGGDDGEVLRPQESRPESRDAGESVPVRGEAEGEAGEGRAEGEVAPADDFDAAFDAGQDAADAAAAPVPAPPMRTEDVKGVGPQGLLFDGKSELATPPKKRAKAPQADDDFGLFAKKRAPEPEQLDIETAPPAAEPKKADPRLDPALDDGAIVMDDVRATNSFKSSKLKPFQRDPNGPPLEEQIAAWLMRSQAKTKSEVAIILDGAGKQIMSLVGNGTTVAYSARQVADVVAAEAGAMHHAHPRAQTLSIDDIAFAVISGEVWAHAEKDGKPVYYKATLTPAAWKAIGNDRSSAGAKMLGAMIGGIAARHTKRIKARRNADPELNRFFNENVTEANRVWAEMQMVGLHRGGVIDYVTNDPVAPGRLVDVMRFIEEDIARDIANRLNGSVRAAPDNRPAGAVRDEERDAGAPQGPGEPAAEPAEGRGDQGRAGAAPGPVDDFDAAFDAGQDAADREDSGDDFGILDPRHPDYDPRFDPRSPQYDAEADRAQDAAKREATKKRERARREADREGWAKRSEAIIDKVRNGASFFVPGNARRLDQYTKPEHAAFLRASPVDGMLQVKRGQKWDSLLPSQIEGIEKQLGLAGGKTKTERANSAFDDLAAIFGEKGLDAKMAELATAPEFDEATYARVLPILRTAAGAFPELHDNLPALVAAMVKRMRESYSRETVERFRPYARRWYDDLVSGRTTLEGDTDDPGTRDGLEPRGAGGASDGDGTATVPPPAGGARPDAGGGPRADEGDGRRSAGDGRIPDRSPSPVGTGSDPGSARAPADRGVGPRGGEPDDAGLPDGRDPAEGTDEDALGPAGLTEPDARAKAQAKADRVPVKPGDRANIDKTLPLLLPEQRDDVAKAEARFAAGHFGMLFTNGTGTGKTYTGAGIAKRFVRQGKTNVLVVAPNNDILLGWQRALADLGVEAEILADTKSAGKGVTLTTYANWGVNGALARRQWDHVVIDEAHALMASGNSSDTDALDSLRGQTRKPGSELALVYSQNRELKRELARLREAQSSRNPPPGIAEAIKAIGHQLNEAHAEVVKTYGQEPRATVTFLSATPFAYPENLDYAEGYLFDYPKEDERTKGGYNHATGRSRFYIENFGYRMKNGKLNKPASHVKLADQLVLFQEKLVASGALSGRELDIESDYERRFVAVSDAAGTAIDNILEGLRDNPRYYPFYERIAKRFDYLSRARLLEAIKAKHAIERARDHMAMGRKVVVFHNFIEGGGFNPFALPITEEDVILVRGENGMTDEIPALPVWEEVLRKFPDIERLKFAELGSPITQFQNAFGSELLLYNGRVPKKKRTAAIATFNTDGQPSVILVQADAGEKGISLHDVTGKHMRVLMNLGLPGKPTQAIQEEGRIYRVGQSPDSDSLYEYFTIGTSWERHAFATKIAERADAVEKLALGEKARALRDTFIEAYTDPTTLGPSDEDGRGSKAKDRQRSALTPWQRAIAYYHRRVKNAKSRANREGVDYYATPEPLGFKMVEWAGLRHGDRVLEPSAGHGAISRFFPDYTDKTIVEPAMDLNAEAALNTPDSRVVMGQFEGLDIGANKFDAVIMNPPFGRAGATAMKHVEKAWQHLVDGGRLVALVPDNGKIDQFVAEHPDAFIRKLYLMPSVAFENAGTSVRTVVAVIDKVDPKRPGNLEALREVKTGGASQREITGETITDFFDRLQDIEAPARPELPPPPPEFEKRLYEVGAYSFRGTPGTNGALHKLAPKGRLGDMFRPIVERAAEFGGEWSSSENALRWRNGDGQRILDFLDSLRARPPESQPKAEKKPAELVPVQVQPARNYPATDNVVILSDRVSRDTWSKLNGNAKLYYGKYLKQGTTNLVDKPGETFPGGWQFPDARRRDGFIAYTQGEIDRGEITLKMARGVFEQEQADVAAFAAWSPERVDREIEANGYSMDDRSKGWVGWVDPLAFVDATTDSASQRVIEEQTGALNREALRRETTSPVVLVQGGKIVGHEGRHRMLAMAKEGVQRAPVIVFDVDRGSVKAPRETWKLTGQYQTTGRKDWEGKPITGSADLDVAGLLPLHYRFRDQILSAMQDGGRPMVAYMPAPKDRAPAAEPPPGGPDTLPRDITILLRQMLPPDIAITFTDDFIEVPNSSNAWGQKVSKAAGTYNFFQRIINIALVGPEVLETSLHEAGHAVQSLMTPQERAVLKGEGERLRAFVRNHPRARMPADQIARAAPVEIEAEAFQLYWMDRVVQRPTGGGIHIIIRRAWERTIDVLTRVRNALRGLGYQNASDVFERARTGGMRDRAENIMSQEEADYLFRTPARPTVAASPARTQGNLPGVPTVQQAAAAQQNQPTGQGNLPVIPTPQQQAAANAASVNRAKRHFSSLSRMDKVRVKVQDRMLAIRRDQERVEAGGQTITEAVDTYAAEEKFPGRAGERIDILDKRHVHPLVEHMKRAKVSLEELDDYLKARHVPERNALIAQRTAGQNLEGSGHSDAWAAQIMASVAADPRAADFAALAGRVDAITRETLDRRFQAGLISRDEYDDLRTKFQFYVPLKGWEADPETAADQQLGSGRGYDIRGRETKAAMGRSSEADSPTAYVISDAQTSIIRSEKNRVLKTLLRYVDQVNDPDRYERVKGQYRQRINQTTGLVERYFVPATAISEREIVSVKVGGREVRIRIKDRDMLRALQQVGSIEMNTLLRMMMKVSRFYASLQTQWNPQFVLTNLPRDVEAALLNISDVKNLPPGTRRKILADVPKAIPGIFKALREARKTGAAPTGRIGAFFEEYRLAGGKVSFGMIDPVETVKDRIAAALDQSKWGKVKNALRDNPLLALISDANEAVENGVRLAAYIALREAGMSQGKAASIARNLTTNFNRRGEWGPAINSLYVFFNASLQGTMRTLSAVRHSRVVQGAVVSMVASGFIMDAINQMIAESFGDDDEERRAYRDIPQSVKERNFIVMIPGTKEYLKIPLAFGYNWFWNAGRVMGALSRGELEPGEAAKQVVLTGVDSFNPMGSAPSLSQYLSPTLADPFVQISENRNFFGGPIQPTSYDRAVPQSQLAYDSVGPQYEWLAEGLNAMTGGSAGRPGLVDISPESFEHLVDFATGGTGRFITNAIKSGAALTGISSREWLPEQTPLLTVFYGSAGTVQAQRDAFYRAWESVDQAKHEIDELKKRGERELMAERRQTYRAELGAYDAFTKARKELTDIRRKKGLLRDKMEGAELQRAIDALEAKEKAVIARAMRALDGRREDE